MRLLQKIYDLASLALVAVVGQFVALVVGDCGWVYYYAAMAGLGTGYGFVGSLVMMWKIRDPLWLAQLAFQMQREVDDGDHPEAVRLHYARLHELTLAEAEAREPGVIRRAWESRERSRRSEAVEGES